MSRQNAFLRIVEAFPLHIILICKNWSLAILRKTERSSEIDSSSFFFIKVVVFWIVNDGNLFGSTRFLLGGMPMRCEACCQANS